MGPAPVTVGSEEWTGVTKAEGDPCCLQRSSCYGPQERFPVALGVDPHRACCRNEGIVSGEFSLGSCLSPEPGPSVFQLLLTQHFRPMADPMDCAHRRTCPLQWGGSLRVFPTPSAYAHHSQTCAPTEIGEHAPTGVSPLVFWSINSEELREVMLSAELGARHFVNH